MPAIDSSSAARMVAWAIHWVYRPGAMRGFLPGMALPAARFVLCNPAKCTRPCAKLALGAP